MAAGLITTIESPASDTGCAIIVAAIRVLLGEIGCKSYPDDVRAIRERGEVLVLLFCVASRTGVSDDQAFENSCGHRWCRLLGTRTGTRLLYSIDLSQVLAR